jgi:hypothetical protein
MFYWTVHPEWPPAGAVDLLGPAAVWPALAALCITGAWALTTLGPRSILPMGRGMAVLAYLAVLALIAGYFAALYLWFAATGLDATEHAYPATVAVLHLWSIAFAIAGAVMAAFCAVSALAGRTDARHNADQMNTRLFWHYAWGFAIISLALTALFPLVA